MARKRMISPEIWDSEDFASLSITARLLFIGLFSNADDEGRGKAKPAFLKSRIFPYDENLKVSDIDKALDEIAAHISIVFYEADGCEYYSLTNWNDWQVISRPTPSRIPPFTEDSMRTHGAFTEDSMSAPCRLTPNRIEKNKNRIEEKEKRARAKEHFSEFWNEYPRKVAKAKAEQAWEKFVTTEEIFKTVMSALREQKKSRQWQEDGGKFIPHPGTWINQKRWEDKLDVPADSGTAMSKTDNISEIEARFMEMYSGG